jgi:lipopolysaccharide transport system permease protein
MLAVYTFVFSTIFKVNWGADGGESGGEHKANFAIMLFAGLIVHGLFAENINRAGSGAWQSEL